MNRNTVTDYLQLVLDEIKKSSNIVATSYPHEFQFGKNKMKYLAEGNTTHGMSWCVDCHESETYIMHNMSGFRMNISGRF